MKKGKQFEIAVHNFLSTLAPNAKVIFDHKVVDKDTGKKRQIDVWIETLIANHFPVSILISCKDYKTSKVDVTHIGAFINEVRSTGASTGILYSKSGFTKPAVKKAAANGLSCCRLYENEQPDIPTLLIFHHFTSRPVRQFNYIASNNLNDVQNWGDLYDMQLPDGKTVYEVLESSLHKFEKKNISSRKLPVGNAIEVDLSLKNSGRLKMGINLDYKHYRGKVEAQLVNGSYCLTNQSFTGTQVGTVIDTWGPHPGPAWEEIDKNYRLPGNTIICILSGGKADPTQLQKERERALLINKTIT